MKCIQCNEETNNPKFCSRSCSATFNNRGINRHMNKYINKKELARKLRKEHKGYKTIANELNISASTIRNWTKDIKTDRKLTILNSIELTPISKLKSNSQVRIRLLDKRGYTCEICKINNWLEKKITLEIHHIDGNNKNNNLDNLQILCPNCHSQTKNYRNNSPA